jgi:HAD superfamily 5'-nucleotidase-like hydrolase
MEFIKQPRIPLNEKVFTTRTLNLKTIKVLGFDMDYTLVVYIERAVEELVFRLSIEHLVTEMCYPDSIRNFIFKPEQIIRGLAIDKKLGNLMKINGFGYVKAALHGEHFYSWDELKNIYTHELVTFSDSRYEMIHTMFSMALCSLFCQAVEHKSVHKTYEELYEDLNTAVDFIHNQGPLKAKILENPQKFIIRDKRYTSTLLMLRDFEKKLILVTNSDWNYANAVMSYCYDPFLGRKHSWQDLFDLVIVDASKPQFFYGNNKFYEVVKKDGHLLKVTGSICEGSFYHGGNALEVEKLFQVSKGQILYVGDHIYSDVYQSKKVCQWRTMLIITELEAELCASVKVQGILNEIKRHMKDKERYELFLDAIKKAQYSKARKTPKQPLTRQETELRKKINSIDQQIGEMVKKFDAHFNPYWGELMWAGNDKSYFSTAIERYACTYTSKVSNLLNYSPVHYFRPPMKTYRT